MSASSSTPAPEPDSQLLNIGKQCADPVCRLVDFLPFKCPHCNKSFCQEHYKVEAHSCPDYDESKHNRVAPDCPFCRIPVAVRPGQDPNVRLEIHFERECTVLTGKLQSKSTPVCARGTCKKVLFSPIRCDTCRQQFCPAHRFPSDHNCNTSQANSAAMPFRPALPSFAGASDAAKNINAKASGAVASVKKSVASAAASASSSAGKPAGSGAPDVFRKTDRRAKAERTSRLKAMRMRNEKGLLSTEEKATLARLEQEAKDDKDCVIM
ncbi:hypothetical protein EST38_g1395 [Candolleomyces aberdarensis]|uniref:AN1-type domain-containing protein n=1 Tax=Candolleomyces aberdarensis TaxID=2316362 RepID=A0A4Q2DV24_9AGAR|nr:hypothetical protein EST38_g1395 [Candolleomyces aberdarensis]